MSGVRASITIVFIRNLYTVYIGDFEEMKMKNNVYV